MIGKIAGITAEDTICITEDLEAKKQLFGFVKEVAKRPRPKGSYIYIG